MSSALLLPATLLLQKDSNASLSALWNRELHRRKSKGGRCFPLGKVRLCTAKGTPVQHACPSADAAKTVCVVKSDMIQLC